VAESVILTSTAIPVQYCNMNDHGVTKQQLGKQTSTIDRLFPTGSTPRQLLYNGFVNTMHYTTIDEAVFSMSSAPSNRRNGIVCDQLLGYARVLKIEL
jgi:hypothetical protein